MKKILALLLLATCFMCACKQEPKEEYILILEDTDSNTKYYVASPSGVVYMKATDSDAMIVWHDSQGETRNIYEVEDDVKD